MDILLLFTPSKKANMEKLKYLLKAFSDMDIKYLQKSASYLNWNCNTWEHYIYKI